MHRCGKFFFGLKLTFDCLPRKVAVEEGPELCRLFVLIYFANITAGGSFWYIKQRWNTPKPVRPSPSSSQGGPAVRTPCWPAGSRRSSWGRGGQGRPSAWWTPPSASSDVGCAASPHQPWCKSALRMQCGISRNNPNKPMQLRAAQTDLTQHARLTQLNALENHLKWWQANLYSHEQDTAGGGH